RLNIGSTFAVRPPGILRGVTALLVFSWMAVSGLLAGPLLEFEAREIDLGEITRGESRDGTFTLHNRGDQPLLIHRVKPACGCTLADYDASIAPGESGEIRVTVHTETLQGPIARSIGVDTNDPEAARISLIVRADVKYSVMLLPGANARMSNVRNGMEKAFILVKKEPTELGSLEIRDLQATIPWITTQATRLTEVRPAGDGMPTGRAGDWVIELGIGADVEYGSRNERITFKTGLTREPEISFPVGVVVRPPVNLSHEALTIVPGSPVEPLLLTVRRKLDPSTLKITAEPKTIDVTVESTGPRHYSVAVRWDGEQPEEGSLSISVAEMTPYVIPVIRKAAD
ncbi:MAG: DUF1573 domain-containing protein, partial [Acidobacteriota bacterium]|nr:DUF1573 domain-containing protein [Acidobacteriota bacterium]